MRKLIIAGRPDRLGARLKNALAAYDFASQIGADYILAWDTVDHVDPSGIPFSDLFDAAQFRAATGIEVVEESCRSTVKRYGLNGPKASMSHLNKMTVEEISGLPDHAIYYGMTATRPTGVAALDRLKAHFANWPLNQLVQTCIDEIFRTTNISNSLAAHIRRGDIIQSVIDPTVLYHGKGAPVDIIVMNFVARYIPTECYVEAISTLAPSGDLAFFSDDPVVQSSLTDRFAGRSYNVAKLLQPFDLTTSQSALAEFCIMTKCRDLLGSNSAFVKVAAELSDAAFHDIWRFVTAKALIKDLSALMDLSTAGNKTEIFSALAKAYGLMFKKAGRPDDQSAMLAFEHRHSFSMAK